MASFTSQAGLADINNSASLTRAIMSAPTKNPFIGIKLPESLQSENSTDNALKKLKMRTETVKANSIVAGDKLAVQRLGLLETKNNFDMDMGEKEFNQKDAMQTFTINDTGRRTNAYISKQEAEEVLAKKRAELEGYKYTTDTDLAYKKYNHKVENDDRTFGIQKDELGIKKDEALLNSQIAIARIKQQYDQGLIDAEKATQQIAESKNKVKIDNAQELSRTTKEKQDEQDVVDGIMIDNIVDGAIMPTSIYDKVEVKDVTESKFVGSTAVADVQVKIAEITANPKFNKTNVVPAVKELLLKIDEIKADTSKSKATKEMEIIELSEKTKYMDQNGNMVPVFNKSTKEYDYNNSKNPATIELKKASDVFQKKWGHRKRKPNEGIFSFLTTSGQELTAKEEATKALEMEHLKDLSKKVLTSGKGGETNLGVLSMLRKKQQESVDATNAGNEEMRKWGLKYNADNTKVITSPKTITTKDQLVPKKTYDAEIEKEKNLVKSKLRKSMKTKVSPSGTKYSPKAVSDALKRVDEKYNKAEANYTRLLTILEASRTRKLDADEAIFLQQMKNDGTLAAATVKARAASKLNKSKINLNNAKAKESLKKAND